jgi:hypothetical protein
MCEVRNRGFDPLPTVGVPVTLASFPPRFRQRFEPFIASSVAFGTDGLSTNSGSRRQGQMAICEFCGVGRHGNLGLARTIAVDMQASVSHSRRNLALFIHGSLPSTHDHKGRRATGAMENKK